MAEDITTNVANLRLTADDQASPVLDRLGTNTQGIATRMEEAGKLVSGAWTDVAAQLDRAAASVSGSLGKLDESLSSTGGEAGKAGGSFSGLSDAAARLDTASSTLAVSLGKTDGALATLRGTASKTAEDLSGVRNAASEITSGFDRMLSPLEEAALGLKDIGDESGHTSSQLARLTGSSADVERSFQSLSAQFDSFAVKLESFQAPASAYTGAVRDMGGAATVSADETDAMIRASQALGKDAESAAYWADAAANAIGRMGGESGASQDPTIGLNRSIASLGRDVEATVGEVDALIVKLGELGVAEERTAVKSRAAGKEIAAANSGGVGYAGGTVGGVSPTIRRGIYDAAHTATQAGIAAAVLGGFSVFEQVGFQKSSMQTAANANLSPAVQKAMDAYVLRLFSSGPVGYTPIFGAYQSAAETFPDIAHGGVKQTPQQYEAQIASIVTSSYKSAVGSGGDLPTIARALSALSFSFGLTARQEPAAINLLHSIAAFAGRGTTVTSLSAQLTKSPIQAATAGISIPDFGALFDIGSRAFGQNTDTYLSQFINKLIAHTPKAQADLNALGLGGVVSQVGIDKYGVFGVIERLVNRLEQVPEKYRNNIIQQIMPSRLGGNYMRLLMEGGHLGQAEDIAKALGGNIGPGGTVMGTGGQIGNITDEMFNRMMKTPGAQLETAWDKIKKAAIDVGTILAPAAIRAAQALDSIVHVIGGFTKEHPTATVRIIEAGLVAGALGYGARFAMGAMEGLGLIMHGGGKIVGIGRGAGVAENLPGVGRDAAGAEKGLAAEAKSSGGMLSALPMSPIVIALAALAAALVVAYIKIKPFHDAVNSLAKLAWSDIQSGIKAVGDAVHRIADGFSGDAPSVRDMKHHLDDLGQAHPPDSGPWVQFGQGLRNVADTAGNVGHFLGDMFATVGDDLSKSKDLRDAVRELGTAFGEVGNAIRSLLPQMDGANKKNQDGKAIAEAFGHVISGTLVLALQGLATTIKITADIVKTALFLIRDTVSILVTSWKDGLKIMEDAGTVLSDLLHGDFSKIGKDMGQLAHDGVKFFTDLKDGILTLVGDLGRNLLTLAGDAVKGVIKWFKDLYDQIVGHSIIPDLCHAIVKWFSDLPGMLAGALGSILSTVVQTFKDIAKGVMDQFATLLGDIAGWFNSLGTKVKTWGGDLMTDIGLGIKDKAGEIKDAFLSAVKDATNAAKNWVGSHNPFSGLSIPGIGGASAQGGMPGAPTPQALGLPGGISLERGPNNRAAVYGPNGSFIEYGSQHVDYGVPYGTQFELPGNKTAKYELVAEGTVPGVGKYETYRTPNGGYITAMHLSAFAPGEHVGGTYYGGSNAGLTGTEGTGPHLHLSLDNASMSYLGSHGASTFYPGPNTGSYYQTSVGKYGGVPADLQRWLPELEKASKKYGIPLPILLGIMQTESSGNPNARSGAGALGLMQLLPSTARSMGVSNIMDPNQNIMGGAKYFASLLHQFGGNTTKALAAYNAGPGNYGAGLGYASHVEGLAAQYSGIAYGGGGYHPETLTPRRIGPYMVGQAGLEALLSNPSAFAAYKGFTHEAGLMPKEFQPYLSKEAQGFRTELIKENATYQAGLNKAQTDYQKRRSEIETSYHQRVGDIMSSTQEKFVQHLASSKVTWDAEHQRLAISTSRLVQQENAAIAKARKGEAGKIDPLTGLPTGGKPADIASIRARYENRIKDAEKRLGITDTADQKRFEIWARGQHFTEGRQLGRASRTEQRELDKAYSDYQKKIAGLASGHAGAIAGITKNIKDASSPAQIWQDLDAAVKKNIATGMQGLEFGLLTGAKHLGAFAKEVAQATVVQAKMTAIDDRASMMVEERLARDSKYTAVLAEEQRITARTNLAKQTEANNAEALNLKSSSYLATMAKTEMETARGNLLKAEEGLSVAAIIGQNKQYQATLAKTQQITEQTAVITNTTGVQVAASLGDFGTVATDSGNMLTALTSLWQEAIIGGAGFVNVYTDGMRQAYAEQQKAIHAQSDQNVVVGELTGNLAQMDSGLQALFTETQTGIGLWTAALGRSKDGINITTPDILTLGKNAMTAADNLATLPDIIQGLGSTSSAILTGIETQFARTGQIDPNAISAFGAANEALTTANYDKAYADLEAGKKTKDLTTYMSGLQSEIGLWSSKLTHDAAVYGPHSTQVAADQKVLKSLQDELTGLENEVKILGGDTSLSAADVAAAGVAFSQFAGTAIDPAEVAFAGLTATIDTTATDLAAAGTTVQAGAVSIGVAEQEVAAELTDLAAAIKGAIAGMKPPAAAGGPPPGSITPGGYPAEYGIKGAGKTPITLVGRRRNPDNPNMILYVWSDGTTTNTPYWVDPTGTTITPGQPNVSGLGGGSAASPTGPPSTTPSPVTAAIPTNYTWVDQSGTPQTGQPPSNARPAGYQVVPILGTGSGMSLPVFDTTGTGGAPAPTVPGPYQNPGDTSAYTRGYNMAVAGQPENLPMGWGVEWDPYNAGYHAGMGVATSGQGQLQSTQTLGMKNDSGGTLIAPGVWWYGAGGGGQDKYYSNGFWYLGSPWDQKLGDVPNNMQAIEPSATQPSIGGGGGGGGAASGIPGTFGPSYTPVVGTMGQNEPTGTGVIPLAGPGVPTGIGGGGGGGGLSMGMPMAGTGTYGRQFPVGQGVTGTGFSLTLGQNVPATPPINPQTAYALVNGKWTALDASQQGPILWPGGPSEMQAWSNGLGQYGISNVPRFSSPDQMMNWLATQGDIKNPALLKSLGYLQQIAHSTAETATNTGALDNAAVVTLLRDMLKALTKEETIAGNRVVGRKSAGWDDFQRTIGTSTVAMAGT